MCLLCRLWDCGWPRMLNASLIYWVWVWLCRGCSQRERPEYPERRRDKKKDLECDRVIKRHRTRGMKQRGGEDRVPTFPQYPQGLEMKPEGINGHPAWWYWKPLFSLKGRKSGWCLLFIQFLNSFQEAKKKKIADKENTTAATGGRKRTMNELWTDCESSCGRSNYCGFMTLISPCQYFFPFHPPKLVPSDPLYWTLDNSDLSIETYIQAASAWGRRSGCKGQRFGLKENFSWGRITLPGQRYFSPNNVFSLKMTDFPSQSFCSRSVVFISCEFGCS